MRNQIIFMPTYIYIYNENKPIKIKKYKSQFTKK